MTGRDRELPAHARIAAAVRQDIESGRLREGQQLPSTRELARTWQASQLTITRAMNLLAEQGYVTSQDRSGRTVTSPAEVGSTLPSPVRLVRPSAVYVGGYPGSGKSEFGRILARETNWVLLDKETITRPLIEPALEDLGSAACDRESTLYRSQIEPREYESLAAIVTENLSAGNSVIAVAPYVQQLRNRSWIAHTTAHANELGAQVTVVWMQCAVETMHANLRRRGAACDIGKLSNWAAYAHSIDSTFRPAGEHVVIHNDPGSVPLRVQAQQLLNALSTRQRQD